jgi:NADPH:quinone reductase-like Zn-dependent oxidoreductase
VLAILASLIADGELEVPIATAYPLADVQDAYRELGQGHVRGKIVLVP